MNPRWVLNKLNPQIPTCVSSLAHHFKPHFPSHHPNMKFVLSNVDLSLLLSVCGREGNLLLGSSFHALIIKNHQFFSVGNRCNLRNALVVWNSLLAMYSKCGKLSDASKLFDRMPVKDTVSWNSMLLGFLRNGDFDVGLEFLRRMHEMGCSSFDQATLTTMLSACEDKRLLHVIKMVHSLVFLIGYDRNISVGNALITSYFKCGSCDYGRQVFDEMLEKNVISWTAVISGLEQNQCYEDSLELFMDMRCLSVDVEPNDLTYLCLLSACAGLQAQLVGRQIHGLVLKLGVHSNVCFESALMDMYSKCGCLEDAWKIFESAEVLDEVTVTVLLVGFAQNGFEEEALHVFLKMLRTGTEIDANMISAVLGVFGIDTSLSLGKQIHSLAIKRSFSSNVFIGNGLINMYSKCGDLEDSVKIFDRMPQKNSVSWNSIIAAFARHGDGLKALQLFEEMRLGGAEPTDVTFLSLLHACSHAGLIEKGMEFLESMYKVHGLCPRMEHYACVVDMYGRAGRLKEAKIFIDSLPTKPDILVWQALLGACSFCGDTEMGKYAAEQLHALAPDNPVSYTLMANIYSSALRWQDRASTIKRMKEMGLTKDTAISWIEIEKKVHNFVVMDKLHPEAENIYSILLGLFKLMTDEGYVPDKKFILSPLVDEDGKI